MCMCKNIVLLLMSFFFSSNYAFISINSEADGAAIQQAVWRPTGTQLGKKKTSKDSSKSEKNGTTKKKNPSKKIKFLEVYVDDGALPETLKQNQNTEQQPQQQQEQEFVFPQQNLPPPPPAPQATEMQPSAQPLSTSQTEFGNALGLAQQSQSIYQHPGLNMVQNWPLDLVQGSHHYPQVCFLLLACLKKCYCNIYYI